MTLGIFAMSLHFQFGNFMMGYDQEITDCALNMYCSLGQKQFLNLHSQVIFFSLFLKTFKKIPGIIKMSDRYSNATSENNLLQCDIWECFNFFYLSCFLLLYHVSSKQYFPRTVSFDSRFVEEESFHHFEFSRHHDDFDIDCISWNVN